LITSKASRHRGCRITHDWSTHVNGYIRPQHDLLAYTGLAPALVAGVGIGELPPLVQPELLRDGRLVEVMPGWRLRTVDLSLVHLQNRYIPRPVRVFKEFAVQMAPTLFPKLPT
jgi:DNA-binding transcriptional LysR family regulator